MTTAALVLVLLFPMSGAVQDASPRPAPAFELTTPPLIPYPPEARRLGVTGDAVFSVRVDARGKATDVKVIEVPRKDVGFEEALRSRALELWFPGRPPETEHIVRVSFTMRPDDEETAVDLAKRFVTAWNAREAPFILASFAPEPHRADKEWAGSPEGREEIRTWLAERLQDERRARLLPAPGSIVFYSSGVARVRLPVDGGGDAYLVMARGDRRWVIRRFDEPLAAADGAFRVGGVIKEPRKLKHVNPVYPQDALEARESGIVILECVISPQGRVVDLKILRGLPMLNQAAIDAVKQWEYTPTLLEGVAVPVIMTVTVNFRLQ